MICPDCRDGEIEYKGDCLYYCERQETIYTYTWANNSKRAAMKGRRCRIVKRLRLNSALIQFLDDESFEVVSRNALRVEKT